MDTPVSSDQLCSDTKFRQEDLPKGVNDWDV